MSAITISIQHCIEYLAGIEKKEKFKSIITGMEETKMPLFNDDMILCNKYSKRIYKLELISEIRKVNIKIVFYITLI